MDKDCADKVASLCIQHYLALPGKSGKPSKPGEWTLMSAVVLEKSDSNLKVVALGTGSKCLGRNELSKDGSLVADSHAEVIARRTLLLYLYGQLLVLLKGEESEVFSKILDNKACLRPDVKFHFFTSHTPCGDASIIPKIEDDLQEGEPQSKVSKLNGQADVHRTGAKCVPGGPQDQRLPGQKYHTVLAVRTKPGRGDPTASLSCSDKISKWCAVGVQGSLLSMLIDCPVKFASITLPSNCPYSEDSLKRALISRLPDTSGPFPSLVQSNVPFPHSKNKGRPCPTSLLWSDSDYLGDRKLEVAVDGRRHGLTKAKALSAAGRLKICKRELFSLFARIAPDFGIDLANVVTYQEAKSKAKDYKADWLEVKDKAFPEWPSKNLEVEMFALNC